MLCASCARSWGECQHFSGGEPWPYVLPPSFTPISARAAEPIHSLCDLNGQAPIQFAAACLLPWWTPLPPGHSTQPTTRSEMVRSQQMCLLVSPASACLAWHCCSLPSLGGNLGSSGVLIDHFLPGFPQKITAALFFTLRCVCLTTAFCSRCHLLLPSTSESTSQTHTILSLLWSLSCDGLTLCT